MKKLEISTRENEELMVLLKKSDSQLVQKSTENRDLKSAIENFVYPTILEIVKNNNFDNEWKNVVQMISGNILGHSKQEMDATISEIEKYRKTESLLAMENRAMQIENEGVYMLNKFEK